MKRKHFYKRLLKSGLHCAIYSTFYALEILWYFTVKNLLRISLTKFIKPNKRRERNFLIIQFKNKQNIKAWFLILKIIFI